MKLNKKGFMMAEVVVVSSVVLIILTTLYISYNKIFSLYETRLSYEDSNLLYALSYYRDYLVETTDESPNHPNKLARAFYYLEYAQGTNNHYDMLLNYNPDDSYLKHVKLAKNNEYNDNVYIIWNHNNEELNISRLGGNKAYMEYVGYLSTNLDLTGVNHLMILERRYTKDNTYKYAYLVLD